jgi:hypothetical protein
MKRQSQFFANRTQVIGLFLLALGVRLAFVFSLENRLYWPDEMDFNNIALGLLRGEGYQSDPFRANPILPFFLAASYKLFGQHYIVPRILQCVIGALTVAVLFSLARHLYQTRVALLAGFALALYPSLVYTSGVFYVDSLFTFLIALTVYLLFLSRRYDGRRSFIFLILSGITLGVAVLCRAIFLSFVPFALFFVVFTFSGRIRRRLLCGAVLAVVTAVTILPWTVRNYNLYDQFLLVSTGSGLFLWRGNNELARGNSDDRYLDPGAGGIWNHRLHELEPSRRRELMQKYDDVRRDLERLNGIDHDRYLQDLAMAYIAQHPARSLELSIKRIRSLYTAFTDVRPEHGDIIDVKKRISFSIIHYATLLLALFGALCALKEWRKYLIVYLPILSLTFAYAALTAAARFRIPFEPYLIVFASCGTIVIFDLLCAVRPGAQRERHQPDSLSGAA